MVALSPAITAIQAIPIGTSTTTACTGVRAEAVVGKPSPHTRIPLGRGICGAAATQQATIVVDDVNADPRYLACSLETKSEIVVPIMDGGEVLGEIDIDSDRHAAFGAADRARLEAVAALLAPLLHGADSQSTQAP